MKVLFFVAMLAFKNIYIVGAICPIAPRLCPPGQSPVFIGQGCSQKCVPDKSDPFPVPTPNVPAPPPIVSGFIGAMCPVPPLPCPPGQFPVFAERSCDQKCVPIPDADQ